MSASRKRNNVNHSLRVRAIKTPPDVSCVLRQTSTIHMATLSQLRRGACNKLPLILSH